MIGVLGHLAFHLSEGACLVSSGLEAMFNVNRKTVGASFVLLSTF